MKRIYVLSIVCAATLAVGCSTNNPDALNQRATPETGTTEGTTGNLERAPGVATTTSSATSDAQQFVQKASAAGMAEVQLGQLAEQRATSPEVKQFAQMMVRDHTKANDALAEVAKQHNLLMATTIDQDHQELMNKLKTLNGAEFDRAYMDAMVEGHKNVKDLLDDHAEESTKARSEVGTTGSSVSSAEMAVNQWAATTLPTIAQHLTKAELIDKKVDKH